MSAITQTNDITATTGNTPELTTDERNALKRHINRLDSAAYLLGEMLKDGLTPQVERDLRTMLDGTDNVTLPGISAILERLAGGGSEAAQ